MCSNEPILDTARNGSFILSNKIHKRIDMTTSNKVIKAIKDQGRKKIWLANELNITRVTLDKKLKDNFWSVGEIMKLQQLGLL